MSKTNQNHIIRQWHIVHYLLDNETYVSSEAVFQHLQKLDVPVKDVRTVQRDLNTLLDIFPIECRKDDKPYGWRWQRIKGSKKQLITHEQAMVLALVDNELRDVLPNDLLKQLNPLFIKAKMMLAGIDYKKHKNEHSVTHSPNNLANQKNTLSATRFNLSISKNILQRLSELNPFKESEENLEPWQYQIKKSTIESLIQHLNNKQMDKLADKLKGIEKKLIN